MRYGFKIRQNDNGRVVSESGFNYDTDEEAKVAGEIHLLRAFPMASLDQRIKKWTVEVINNSYR